MPSIMDSEFFFSTCLIVAPMMSCSQQVQTGTEAVVVGTTASSRDGKKSISTATGVEVTNAERNLSRSISGHSVSIGTINVGKSNPTSALANLPGQSASKMDIGDKMLSVSGLSRTEIVQDGMECILSDKDKMNEVEMATYEKVKESMITEYSAEYDEIAASIKDSIDTNALQEIVGSSLSEEFGAEISSIGSAEVLSEEVLNRIAGVVQSASDAQGGSYAENALPVAEGEYENLSGAGLDALNASSTDTQIVAASRSMILKGVPEKQASTDRDRLLQLIPAPETVSSDEAMKTWINDTGYGATRPGDVLWMVNSDFTGQAVTGHAALWEKMGKRWFTADAPNAQFDKNKAYTDYWSNEDIVIRNHKNIQMKMMRVNSDKTDQQIEDAINAKYQQYRGRGYYLVWLKSDDSNKLYCSQVSWLVWKSLGKDIDGSFLPSSFVLRNAMTVGIPVTVTVGWWTVTVTLWVVYIIVTIWTIDTVYPWDIVIDDDTKEYLRYGNAM